MSQSVFMGRACAVGQQSAALRSSLPPTKTLHFRKLHISAAIPAGDEEDKGQSSGGRRRGDGGRSRQSQPWDKKSGKGNNFTKKSRRSGRPEWMRKPDDSPLRDGNRDRLIGFVTIRAARTLQAYLNETSPVIYHWLNHFVHDNPIPRDGAWDDVSGDSFLRKLLKMPTELATGNYGRETMYSSGRGQQVDPRQIALRIMEIRIQLAKEMIQDLGFMSEENNDLMRETLLNSFSLNLDNVASHPSDAADKV